jgi:hypothetical protein
VANVPHDLFAQQVIEHMAAIGGDRHASANLTQFGGLLIHRYAKARPLEGQRGGQAANASSNNKNMLVVHYGGRLIQCFMLTEAVKIPPE